MSIIRKPIITEKSLILASRGWYSFAVEGKSTKSQISREIKLHYKVDIIDIRTITMPGKSKRVGKKLTVKQLHPWKKAIVRLKKGQTIEDFTVTSEGEKIK